MGYMNSMDIQHDRAGFYLCWGCLVSSNRYGVKAGDLLEVEDFSGGGSIWWIGIFWEERMERKWRGGAMTGGLR